MASLKNSRGLTIVVPDDVAADYLRQGWVDLSAPAPAVKKKKSRSSKAKGASGAVSSRTAGVPASVPVDPGSVQLGTEDPGYEGDSGDDPA